MVSLGYSVHFACIRGLANTITSVREGKPPPIIANLVLYGQTAAQALGVAHGPNSFH